MWVLGSLWILGSEPKSSARPVSALKPWILSPVWGLGNISVFFQLYNFSFLGSLIQTPNFGRQRQRLKITYPSESAQKWMTSLGSVSMPDLGCLYLFWSQLLWVSGNYYSCFGQIRNPQLWFNSLSLVISSFRSLFSSMPLQWACVFLCFVCFCFPSDLSRRLSAFNAKVNKTKCFTVVRYFLEKGLASVGGLYTA